MNLVETKRRSITKTVTWRLVGSGATFAVSYLMIGSVMVAGTIATIQVVSNTILYYFHERLWNSIDWGRM